MMSKEFIKHIIDNLISEFDLAFRDNRLIANIADIKIVNNQILTGTQFQLSLFVEPIKSYYDYAKNDKSLYLVDNLEALLIELNTNYGFNYFDKKYIPDDLDTASSVVRVLKSKNVVDKFLDIVSENITQVNTIPTWLNCQNSNSRWASGDWVWHIDVMLNYYLTLSSINKLYKKDIKFIRELITQQQLRNYWYIPKYYTPYLFSKLLLSANEFFDSSDARLLERYIDEINSKEITNSNCKFESINKILIEENNQFNWLDKCFEIGTKVNVHKLKNEKYSEIESELLEIIKDIEKERNNYTPSLYWSLGFKKFSSNLIGKAFYLEILVTILKKL